MSAQSLKVLMERDYTTTDSYPYYWMGDRVDDNPDQPYFCDGTATVEIIDGALRIENTQMQANRWNLQPFVLDWFNTTEGEDYTIRIWAKAEMDGSANLSIGTWSTSVDALFEFRQSDDFEVYSIDFTAVGTSKNNDIHILFQMGETIGTIYIQKIQILQRSEDKPELSTYGNWKPLVSNSDMEGNDVSCFWTKIWDDEYGTSTPTYNSEIIDGVGVDDSRGIMVAATEIHQYAWDNQFWFRLNEPVEAGTKYRVRFDCRADISGYVSTQAHADPGVFNHYEMFGNIFFTGDWQTYEYSGTVSEQQSPVDKMFQSVAFNLNDIANANNFYFDNIYFEILEEEIDVQYGGEAIKVLFPYYTNTCRLMLQYADGMKRLLLPNEMFRVTVDGKTAKLNSVEIDATGAIFVFLDEKWMSDKDIYLDDESKVVVSFINPEGEYNIFRIDTGNNEAVENFVINGRYDDFMEQEWPYFQSSPAVNANALYIADGLRFSKTKTNILPISLQNEDDILGFQLDVVLPEGMTLAKNNKGENIVTINSKRTATHTLTARVINDFTVRIVGISMNNDALYGNDGELLELGINVASWGDNGDYAIQLKDVKMTNIDKKTLTCSDKTFMVKVGGKLGDVNNDEEIDVTDVVLIIDDILMKNPSNYDASLADVNSDSYIDVTDVVMVIDAILGKIELSRGAELIDRSAYTAFQMDLTIPAGYVLESVTLTDIAKDSHSLAYNMLPDGRCRVVVCSMNNEALPGAWDEVISLNLRGKGDAQVNIDRAVFVTIDGERHELMMNPTSIAQLSTLNSQLSTRYDLQGRKIEKNVKGVLIENGKKVVKK